MYIIGYMRINNVSSKTSKQILIILFIFVFIATAFYIGAYLVTSIERCSVLGFFKWVVPFIQRTISNESDDKIILFLLMVAAPLILYFSFIWTLVEKIKAIKEFYSILNLKNVDLLPDRIQFNFTQPQYNFVCSYQDVEQLDMNIVTTIVHTKNGSHVAFQELILNFTLLNGKIFSLNNTTFAPMKVIYEILNHAGEVQNFNFYFSGAGQINDIKEKIENYMRFGKKQMYGADVEKSNKLLSTIFFVIGLVFIFVFHDMIDDFVRDPGLFLLFIPLSSFLLISFVIDIFLVINEINKIKIVYANLNKKFYEKINIWHILTVKACVIIVLILTVFHPFLFINHDKKILNDTKQSKDLISLKVHNPSEYNYMNKRDIYNLRERYVKDSLFYKEGYKPSEEVFGQIVDGKPWWGLISCGELNYKGDYHQRIEGDSKVSVQMNNPNALVGLSMPYLPWSLEDNQEFCTGYYSKFIPLSLKYDKKETLIIAKYEITKLFLDYRQNIDGKSHRIPIQLSGLNALDFGYKYVWAFDSKNIKIMHKDSPNVLNDVRPFRDFVHLGGSCRYEGGCNNISPLQEDLMIKIVDLPAEISLKLWKKEPQSKYLPADFYYKIIFDER